MKEALQQAEEAEEAATATTIESSTPSAPQLDAKGRPLLTPEQKAKKAEKDRKIAAEVS